MIYDNTDIAIHLQHCMIVCIEMYTSKKKNHGKRLCMCFFGDTNRQWVEGENKFIINFIYICGSCLDNSESLHFLSYARPLLQLCESYDQGPKPFDEIIEGESLPKQLGCIHEQEYKVMRFLFSREFYFTSLRDIKYLF